ncbi:hypothetical protein [Edaphosphingomonas haloaromaticamans]|uniref:Antitoxin Xre/MbcA/ParS-like toxin-binding domain-containing protein n=1 Tax=Edaphosphingomonas haloaromaticamans TaxID=653954 RepID=A0A1S1HCR7_9SPHN|nr:hypothetical protein [Sphingomonas haloaromaticamans]OHT19935.1 hypothetical protein BHE75_01928 [Sphingomonas haloaromaticamans]
MTSSLIDQIENFLGQHSMSPITFGRKALGDPHFVRDLRGGRDVRLSTVERVKEFMEGYRADQPPFVKQPRRHRRTAPGMATA